MRKVILNDVITIISGGTPKTSISEYWNGDIGWLSVVDFNNDYRKVYKSEKTITSLGLKNSSTKMLNIGDVIISARGTVGALAQIGKPMCFNQSCFGLRGKDGIIENDYLYYALKNYMFNLKKRTQGSVFETINLDSFKLMEIDIYEDIKVQKNIIKILSIIDDKIELNNKINEELENIAKTLYNYWFVQFDFPDENERPYKSSGGKMIFDEKLKRNIPFGWSVNNVKSCIKHINTGLNPRNNFILNNGDIKYITVKNLTTHGCIDFSNCDTIDEFAQKIVHKRSDISKGDILFASIAPLGRCYLIQEEPQTWDINESVFSIRPQNNIPSEYLYMFLMSETFVKKAENSSTGSVFAGIRIKTLEGMLLVIPDNKILQLFKEKISKILLQKHIKEYENQELTTIRDFLLPMLMNGQVTIQG